MSLKKDSSEQSALYAGLRESARDQLEMRDYSEPSLDERLAAGGVEAQALLNLDEKPSQWIPGFEIFPRRVFRQRHRGHFGELIRTNEGVIQRIGLQPRQWSASLMFAGTAKGFHIHPPHIPEGRTPEDWFQELYGDPHAPVEKRPYDREQWDAMFFIQGNVEVFLVDERQGLPRRRMRFIIDGDDTPGPNNAGIIIPAGVSHALLCESSRNLLIVYGTSTTFQPAFEGRIGSAIEKARLPEEWQQYFGSSEE